MKDTTRQKIRVCVKTFLLLNKGKSYTSNEIATFINTNRLGIPKHVNHTWLTRMIKIDKAKQTILSDITVIEEKNKKTKFLIKN